MSSILNLSCLSGPPLFLYLPFLTGVLLHFATPACPYITTGLEGLDGLPLEGTRNLWKARQSRAAAELNVTWPDRKVVTMDGDLIIGGLMMMHERHNDEVCGPIMPQGGVQALEAMLYTLDFINDKVDFIPGVKLGAHILDDCDKDTYGLEQAVDFIKAKCVPAIHYILTCASTLLATRISLFPFTVCVSGGHSLPSLPFPNIDCHTQLPFPHTTTTATSTTTTTTTTHLPRMF
ncbi:Metabotropic glutamate receptor 2 [Portunus trituberculatus]|uniref:Metabotropic glutamate receptor 2 n=1 Tax=Portunus trituberculatus TaxID=210409 RepID=A0A5B7GPQ6_PORTR|nr:Metabotropic glutamate receptor 2 [Portunus trituberculatus]